MTLSVEDDGCGMDVAAMGAKGNGLGGIERRVRILGGRHAWQTGPMGGAMLLVRVPLLPDGGGAADAPELASQVHPLPSSNATRPDR
ncbi:MAG: hypothetical protein IPK05_18925 [Comamonadaceae bacterium]|nr:hypothetical protein [Comamonadaceae bacterium]